jgi:23S rRNA pseudouridine2605 synthase
MRIPAGRGTRLTGRPRGAAATPRHGLARVLSKQGLCSRTEAARWIVAGRVEVDGRVVLDPEFPVVQGRVRITIDGKAPSAGSRLYLMLNKPRGLVTTARDERGRDTVYRCFDGADLPWLAPVGRLDQASEGLLLFSNDPEWAGRITAPDTGPEKTYHVQVDAVPPPGTMRALELGVVDRNERLRASSVRLLRAGARNAWLEIVLDEGRNRQIRRLLAAHGIDVLRLVRVAIGPLSLGDLPKGGWRMLDVDEAGSLAGRSAQPGID